MPINAHQKNASAEDVKSSRLALWIVDEHKKKAGGIVITVVGIMIILLCWMMYGEQTTADDAYPEKVDLDISSRVIVPELKRLPEDALDNETIRGTHKEASEDMRLSTDDDDLMDARMKSAIVAQDLSIDALQDTITAGTDGVADKGPLDANSRFVQSVSGHGVAGSEAQAIQSLEYKILQGKMIEAVLESRATSDLPGMVCATVQRDVYGAQQRIALIPWGARVCGQYSADVRTGQERLFVVWNTLRRPDGVEVTLDSVGADQLGTAGMGGLVDTHFAKMFGVSSLLSIIGTGTGNLRSSRADSNNNGAYYRDTAQMAASQTAHHILQPYINMPPTITVPAGARIRIYVNRDLDFSAVYQTAGKAAAHDVMILE
jgi:type IV secretion system protein VirB10